MDDVVKNFVDDCNSKSKRKKLIVFDEMVVDINTNKEFQVIKELFIKCRRLNISLTFIAKSYFLFSKRSPIKFYILSNNENSQ